MFESEGTWVKLSSVIICGSSIGNSIVTLGVDIGPGSEEGGELGVVNVLRVTKITELEFPIPPVMVCTCANKLFFPRVKGTFSEKEPPGVQFVDPTEFESRYITIKIGGTITGHVPLTLTEEFVVTVLFVGLVITGEPPGIGAGTEADTPKSRAEAFKFCTRAIIPMGASIKTKSTLYDVCRCANNLPVCLWWRSFRCLFIFLCILR